MYLKESNHENATISSFPTPCSQPLHPLRGRAIPARTHRSDIGRRGAGGYHRRAAAPAHGPRGRRAAGGRGGDAPRPRRAVAGHLHGRPLPPLILRGVGDRHAQARDGAAHRLLVRLAPVPRLGD
ncbi:MAG: hypothetical protein LIO90_09495, partial [Bacteroidales bacterium]|nr:hypothetical protein [Bacteroidales bacterium]